MTIPEISAAQLLAALEAPTPPGQSLQVLDIRAPERVAMGHVEAASYLHLPAQQVARRVAEAGLAADLGLDRGRPVAVICDRGMSSRPITELLVRQGFDARSLVGGMLGWSFATARRAVPGIAGLDRLVQLDRVGKSALGYFAVRAGEAIAVDPGRDLAPWLELLEETGARLVGVVDTHCHADYLSGGPALAAECGVPYYLHPLDAIDPYAGRPARIAFTPLADGAELALGDARLRVEYLPGHTEGSVALRLGDELVLSGDLLFVASIGRPDLADRTAAWTELLWASLQRVKRSWSPELRVFPAHYGAETERQPSRVVEGRLGELLQRNPPLAIAGAQEFAAWVRARTTGFPDDYRRIKLANLGLIEIDSELADELDAGKNRCALAG